MTDADFERVAQERDQIEGQFAGGGPLGRFAEDAHLLLGALQDYRRGAYRKMQLYAVGAISFALLYVLTPLDFIPVAGQLDDAAVVGLCLKMVEKDLHAYRAWKAQQTESAR